MRGKADPGKKKRFLIPAIVKGKKVALLSEEGGHHDLESFTVPALGRDLALSDSLGGGFYKHFWGFSPGVRYGEILAVSSEEIFIEKNPGLGGEGERRKGKHRRRRTERDLGTRGGTGHKDRVEGKVTVLIDLGGDHFPWG